MKKNLINILLILVFLLGLSLLIYPTFSDYWNSFHQSRVISTYTEKVSEIDNTEYEHILTEAREYNQKIPQKQSTLALSDERKTVYETLLNVSGDGVMGYIEIPNIDVHLPIYHGTSDAVLQVAIGHIEGSALPVGGEGTHCVISGHRGLPSAKLFTDLDKLVAGDLFHLKVLDENLTYEVDQILIVEPDDIDALQAEDGKDYCTLVTCTPYGINSHRLLVRGHRIDNVEDVTDVRVTGDAFIVEPIVVAPIIAIPILLVLFVWLMIAYAKPKKKN